MEGEQLSGTCTMKLRVLPSADLVGVEELLQLREMGIPEPGLKLERIVHACMDMTGDPEHN